MQYKAMKRAGTLKRTGFKTKPRSKRTKRQKKVEDADKAWGLAVRKTDKDLCQWCKLDGKQVYGNQPHHIVSRSHKVLRWDVENGVTLCYPCHMFRITREPVEYTKFLFEWLGGEKIYNNLKERSKINYKHTIEELEAIISNLNYLLNGK